MGMAVFLHREAIVGVDEVSLAHEYGAIVETDSRTLLHEEIL
jgi:hypothetical protein